jgi:hypothetical protein
MQVSDESYYIRAIDFAAGKATVRLEQPLKTPEDRCPLALVIPVTPEHARALTQYIGEEVQFFALPTCATFDNVVTYKPRAT